jgi:hypothetical protein
MIIIVQGVVRAQQGIFQAEYETGVQKNNQGGQPNRDLSSHPKSQVRSSFAPTALVSHHALGPYEVSYCGPAGEGEQRKLIIGACQGLGWNTRLLDRGVAGRQPLLL